MKTLSVSAYQHNRRMKHLHKCFSWLLLVGFLAQPIISYLAAPSLVEAKNGQQVLICTLKGLQLVTLDSDNIHEAVVDMGDCPALTLNHLIASSLPTEPVNPIFPAHPPEHNGALDEPPQAHERHYPDYVTRAPPIS